VTRGGIVDIIDTTSDTLDTTHGPVTVGQNALFGIVYDPIHQTMYVSNSASDDVSVINTDTGLDPNEVIVTINDITHASGLAYDPVNDEMYVTEFLAILSSNVRVIDTNTNTPEGDPIPVGSLPQGIAYESVRGRMYVANFGSDSVSVIQITTATTTIDSAIDGNGSPVTSGGATTSDDITFTFMGTATAPTTVASFECSLDGSAFVGFAPVIRPSIV
jgi:DNA-binding beta-propeller fold protein YncE